MAGVGEFCKSEMNQNSSPQRVKELAEMYLGPRQRKTVLGNEATNGSPKKKKKKKRSESSASEESSRSDPETPPKKKRNGTK